MDWYKLIVGILGIVYGVGKIIVGAVALSMSDETRARLAKDPFWRLVFSTDTTLAAQFIEIALVVFGIYTIANSLDIFGIVKMPFINTRTFLYSFYGIIGIILVAFYYLVVYTNAPISKKEEYMTRYKIVGLIGGILFLITTPVYILYHQIIDHGGIAGALRNSLVYTLGSFGAILFLLAMIAVIIYDTVKSKNKDQKVKLMDIVTFVLIPAGWR